MEEEQKGITICSAEYNRQLSLPYASNGIQAGFPSPANDFISETIDLNVELIAHPAATFFGRVSGNSMIDEGINDGDILIIDRSLEPQNGDLAVCCIDGEFTLKRLRVNHNKVWLIPSNTSFKPILVSTDNRFIIWGIVSYTIKKNRRRVEN